jgi:hypothetical protein
VVDGASSDGPARRRASWSLKTIVEDVAGKPIGEFQDPSRPVHPYLAAKAAPAPAPDGAPPYDPVGHLYPPLVGAPGREYHGPGHEHHDETLDRHRPAAPVAGEKSRPPGPTHRPERLYLHYLLLHMDRLSDTALRYLRLAVEEEVAHRARTPFTVAAPAPKPEASAPPEAAPPAPAAP